MSRPIFVVDLQRTVSAADAKRVCAPRHYEHIVWVRDEHEATVEAMAVAAGVFPSRSQARRAGFSGAAPWGLELLGTNQRTFWVWNPGGIVGACTLNRKRIKSRQWFAFDEVMR